MPKTSISTPSQRPGGRTARTRDAVFDAALAELGANGYSQTTVESIALRAGVHKTTVYRRWRTKGRLLADALAHAARARTVVADTGDIDADMRTLARAVVATITSPEGLATVRAIVSESASPELGEVLRQFWSTRLDHIGPIIDGAIGRGQLPPSTSPTELMKYVAAPLYYQLLMTEDPLTYASADRAAAAAVAAARAGVLAATDEG